MQIQTAPETEKRVVRMTMYDVVCMPLRAWVPWFEPCQVSDLLDVPV